MNEMIIIVQGGVVLDIYSKQETKIHIYDLDEIKSGGCPCTRIINKNEDFNKELSNLKEEYGNPTTD